MPDDTPTWIDDAAFYDDAWRDMDRRLNARDRRRGVVWWLVGLLVFLVGVGGYWWLSGITSAGLPQATAFPVAEASAVAPAAVLSENDRPTGNKVFGTEDRPAVSAAVSPASKGISEGVVPREPANSTLSAPARRRPNELPAISEPVAAGEPVTAPQPVGSVVTGVAATRNTITTVPLPNRGWSLLPKAASFPNLAPVQPRKQPFVSQPFLTGRFIGAPSAGAGLGIGADLGRGRRLTFPASVNVRLDNLPRGERSSGLGAADVPEMVEDSNGVTTEGQDQIRPLVEIVGVRTLGVELRGGVSYRPGKRFRLSADLGVNYLVHAWFGANARQPAQLAVAGNIFNDRYVGVNNLSLSNVDQFRSIYGNEADFGWGPDSPLRLRRWQFRLGGSVGWQLTPRIGLEAHGSAFLTRVTRGGDLRTPRGQFGLGLRYRLR